MKSAIFFYTILYMVLALSPPALAQITSCHDAVTRGKQNCESVVNLLRGPASVAPTSSLSGGAADLASASQTQQTVLSDARDYCANWINLCEALCKVQTSQSGENLAAASSADRKCGEIIKRGNIGNPGCCPLVIQMGEEPIELTPQAAGVTFDILGRRSLPEPHTPVLISWLTPLSRQSNYFLTLPMAEGRVLGVDELFGNNTFGPDADFAKNGFEALKKYDGRREDGSIDPALQDGVIDQNDPVFAQLRMWHDVNGNGMAEPDELLSLQDLGILSIDLNYQAGFEEYDKFGNAILTKSTVRLVDDQLRLIFDIWFNKVIASSY